MIMESRRLGTGRIIAETFEFQATRRETEIHVIKRGTNARGSAFIGSLRLTPPAGTRRKDPLCRRSFVPGHCVNRRGILAEIRWWRNSISLIVGKRRSKIYYEAF